MDSNPFKGEQLYSLSEIAKKHIVRRTYDTLDEWAKDGAENLSGDRVRLDVWKIRGVNHTSLEAVDRFITAQNSATVKCRIIGGCMDGRERPISSHIERITTAQLSPDVVAPADELYQHRKYSDKRGQVRHFLIWVGVDNADQVVMQRLEAE